MSDVERLTEELVSCARNMSREASDFPSVAKTKAERMARAVLASDWLAERERAAAEKALRDAAGDVWGISDTSAGSPVFRAQVEDWLRARADRLASGGQP
jgi:hypothetical protein